MTDLNPCYFCGAPAVRSATVSGVELSAQVICSHCGATGTKMSELPTTDAKFEQTVEELSAQAVAYWQEASVTIDPTHSSHWHEDETWSVEDWQYEIANDDTRLGYADWVRWQKEMSEPEDDEDDEEEDETC